MRSSASLLYLCKRKTVLMFLSQVSLAGLEHSSELDVLVDERSSRLAFQEIPQQSIEWLVLAERRV